LPSPCRAKISVRTHEHAPTRVIDDQLIQIAVLCAAQVTVVIRFGGLERIVVKIKTDDLRVGRDRIDALFSSRPKQLNARHFKFRVIEFRNG
jgi:hypothetical protein